jgi:hypothetical protein
LHLVVVVVGRGGSVVLVVVLDVVLEVVVLGDVVLVLVLDGGGAVVAVAEPSPPELAAALTPPPVAAAEAGSMLSVETVESGGKARVPSLPVRSVVVERKLSAVVDVVVETKPAVVRTSSTSRLASRPGAAISAPANAASTTAPIACTRTIRRRPSFGVRSPPQPNIAYLRVTTLCRIRAKSHGQCRFLLRTGGIHPWNPRVDAAISGRRRSVLVDLAAGR